MPTYEYRCDSCGRTFEQFQSMNDPRLETCILDDCRGKVTRLLGRGAGIIFKGSGFYQTDYRSDSYKSAQKADSGGGESKPAKPDSGGSSGSSSTSGSAPSSATPAPSAAAS